MAGCIKSETELIQTYLAPLTADAPGAFALLDDAAMIAPPPGMDLVVTTDPIIAGVHFFASDRADDIAWKALAVNISDLAAKGAAPLAYTLALAFPEAPDRDWMAKFAGGLAEAQVAFGCTLIGGDTDRTSGPLSIGVTAIGAVPAGRMVKRGGAENGDRIFITGTLGDSALGLRLHQDASAFGPSLTDGDKAFLVGRYLRPSPRVALADVLVEFAHAALDVSDGLAKDLPRLAGDYGAIVNASGLPLSPSAKLSLEHDARVADLIVGGGDDYEILAAVPAARAAAFAAAALAVGVQVTEIGVLGGAKVEILGFDGGAMMLPGYDHFGGRG